jgi:hypothetical protein
MRRARLILRRGEKSSQHRLDSQHPQKIRRCFATGNALRLAPPRQREFARPGSDGHPVEHVVLPLPVEKILVARVAVLAAGMPRLY